MGVPSGGGLHHEDDSAYSFAGTGRLLGTNELDAIVTRFSAAVSQLTQDARQMSRGGTQGSTAAGGAASGFSSLLTASGGSGSSRGGGGGFGVLLPGSGGWYGGGPGGGGAGGGPGSGTGSAGGGGGGGGLSSALMGAFAGGAGGMVAGAVGFAGGYLWSRFSNFAQSSLGQQVTMSSYLAQQMSMVSGQGRGRQQAILNQAFGNNAMATGVSDAAVGQAILNAVSGFSAVGAPGYAQPLAQGAQGLNALLNYTNGLNYAQSSSLTSLMMSPQVGMNFLRLGLGNAAPVQIGGKVNTNAAGMFESLMHRLAPGENISQLRYNLRSGGVLSSELSQLFGVSGQQLESISTSMLDVAKLQSEGLSTTKINQLMQQAGSGNRAAQNQLQSLGVNLTDLQAMKDVQSTKTSRQADIEQGFSDGLQAATQSLQQFNNALNDLLKLPGVAQITGYASGYKAGSDNQGNLGQSILGSLLNPVSLFKSGIHRVGGFFSHLFGGGAASPAQKTYTRPANLGHKPAADAVPRQGTAAVAAAESQLGVPYRWGAETPGSGFDCSGLVQWAYEQAGISLPRTSQAQWAYLHRRQIPLNKVQEGDIVFSAGSDGTSSAPGHEALMISSKQLIQAPYAGKTVEIGAFDPGQWLYAARPSGNLAGQAPGGPATGSTSSSTAQGNAGAAPAGGGLSLSPGSYGSVDELQAVQGALLGGINVSPPAVSSSGGNSQSAGTTPGGSQPAAGGSSTARGGTPAANKAIAKALLGRYGWGAPAEWAALQALWQQESSWSQYADTRKSGLDAAHASIFAYGIAQARPYSKMPRAGWPSDKGGQSNAGVQVTWGLQYIKGQYGDPVRAEQHEQSLNWYGTGTPHADKGWAWVGERGPEIMKLAGGEQILNASQSAHIARQDAKAPMSHPYASLLSGSFSLPDLPAPASPAVAAASGRHDSGNIVLQFNERSIVLGAGATPQDARDFASAVAKAMAHHQAIQAIAAGDLHG